MDQEAIRLAIEQLVAAARLEGFFDGLCRIGDEDEQVDALLDACEEGRITAKGLRQVARSDLLALLEDPDHLPIRKTPGSSRTP